MKRKKSGKRRQRALLLALVGLLAGAGAWNYQRNLALEQQAVRPYRTLSDGDLALLLAATESEVKGLSSAYGSARGTTAGRGAGSDRWKDFEKVQQRSRSVRELGYRVSEHEATLAEMRAEQARRAGQGGELQVLLRRIFVFSL